MHDLAGAERGVGDEVGAGVGFAHRQIGDRRQRVRVRRGGSVL